MGGSPSPAPTGCYIEQAPGANFRHDEVPGGFLGFPGDLIVVASGTQAAAPHYAASRMKPASATGGPAPALARVCFFLRLYR